MFHMAAHAFVGCDRAGDLDGLHNEEHAHPHELESTPDC